MKSMNSMSVVLTFAAVLTSLVLTGSALARETMFKDFVVTNTENAPDTFAIQLAVDHENCCYTEGELMRVAVKSESDGYLYLFYENAGGDVSLLFPNNFQSDNFIKKDEVVAVPAQGQNFALRAAAPFGTERLLAVVSKQPVKGVFKDLGTNFTAVTPASLKCFRNRLAYRNDIVVEETQQTQSSETSQQEMQEGIDFARKIVEITTVEASQSNGLQQKTKFPF